MPALSQLETLILLNKSTPGGGAPLRSWLMTGQDLQAFLEVFERGLKDDDRAEWNDLRAQFSPRAELETCHARGIQIVTLLDEDYPALLREIHDPPVLLYKKGTLLDEDRYAVGIVGSRMASLYGMRHGEKIALELAEMGVSIVSGMARGIDYAAHRGALRAGGRTLAVLGCGMDVIYPREHRDLFDQIVGSGAILSEFALGTEPRGYHFPRRNRILSGLSLGVLVVEAHLRSGSLITAGQALEQGREVFALPGPVDHMNSRGTHQLIREGACLVESAEDLFGQLHPLLKDMTQTELPSKETEKSRKGLPVPLDGKDGELVALLKKGPLFPDEILEQGEASSDQVYGLLLSLEIAGRIRRNPDGSYGA